MSLVVLIIQLELPVSISYNVIVLHKDIPNSTREASQYTTKPSLPSDKLNAIEEVRLFSTLRTLFHNLLTTENSHSFGSKLSKKRK